MTKHDGSECYEAGRSARLVPLLSVGEVCGILGCSRTSLYRWLARGDIHPVRVGSRAKFDPAEIRRYLNSRSDVWPPAWPADTDGPDTAAPARKGDTASAETDARANNPPAAPRARR